MKRFTIAKFGRTLLTVAVIAVISFGCGGGGGGGGDNPANNNTGGNNNNGGDATHDSRLVCADGEAWMEVSSCASLRNGADGVEFKSNGDIFYSDYRDGGFLERDGKRNTWRTNGNTLIMAGDFGDGGYVELSGQYEISNGTLTFIWGDGSVAETLTKCSGFTIR
ncbi:MAG: hypothetical protein LBC59_10010 [Chitinispirillales bacterium]|jgi:hypothetical protein|nr:hypothetical protein [Chitinispirillales bacterium]